jgi:steroid delta-isomerase-like uncharacterized protein
MNDASVVTHYFEAWNRNDLQAVVELFAHGGTYADPTVPEGVSGPALSALVSGFMAAFSDLTFELLEVIDSGQGLLAAQWLMLGVHTGPLGTQAPTGASVSLPGVDIFRIYEGKIQSVEGFYDTATLHRQLGLV